MAKGGTFENEVCKELSLWFSEGIRDDLFCRSDGSGGRFTKRIKKGKDTANQGGDISFSHSDGESLIKIWCIECKTGYGNKNKIKDADGDVVKIPIYKPAKKGDKKLPDNERVIIGWKNKVSVAPWDVLDYIDSHQKKTVLQKMREQCKRDADLTNRISILIFRRNNREKCICLSINYYCDLVNQIGLFPENRIQVGFGDNELVILSLKHFFKWAINLPETIKNRL